ncbi:ABC transporter permease [Chlamydia muridarum str. Nigg]|uniref:Peptide permease n=2 Tax=Chlamydia muridarum TaxID=83560 RepID=A0A069ZX58_CHLMR|nr:ABC transporter permease [Chlamydia muridarum]AAF39320.1 peptide ABC transporter, permease protein [Chlamydia muridarum str. Nigg]AHH22857.1 peptide permease [Chlamydia muridarum str. Nigg3 CMUT3-5]AHH23782.1 peptide permease [Chlamydia muridarum str. Nigg CM972]AID37992.1 peptide permease [Chlamydia muridarum str. Nigg 2 MCR]AIT90654.1 peptide permease [Chlamydia muridarum]
MLGYIKKRLLFNLLSLWVVVTLTFFIIRTIPGDPFNDENGNVLSEEILAILNKRYGLDKPLFTQYLIYLKCLLTLDFGESLIYKDRTVIGIITTALPSSAILGLESLCLALFGGITLGILAAFYKRGCGRTIFFSSIIQISVPAFVIGAFLQYIFAIKYSLLPIACWGDFSHTLLPSIALAIAPMAFITQLTYASVSASLKKDYVLLAYAKGLSPLKVLIKHVLPYALFPVISYSAFLITTLMTGTFSIENLFCIPGLGKWFICSIKQRDYPMTLGLSVFYGAFFMLISLLCDLLQAWIDPQIRYSYGKEHSKQ